MTAAARAQPFRISGSQFLLNDKPLLIHSGELHYSRIPHEYWRDRLQKLKAAGLNTVCTYVFWDLHEPEPGRWDFAGDKDLAGFIRIAGELGLHVLLRPGPYVCSEWDFGGLPPWLLRERGIKVRCADHVFMAAAERYLKRLGQEVVPLLVTHGGPVLMVQVENEYGSYGNDRKYLAALKELYLRAGFDVPFFTSDGGAQSLFEAGALPDALPVVNFGGDAKGSFAALGAFRRNIPQMCGEYWCGWFTHWRDSTLGRSDIRQLAKDVRWMLENGISFNLYMFHGGTNFGWMAGANYSQHYEPDITSYDYDAPLDEAGNLTEKYTVLRALLKEFGAETSAPPAASHGLAIPAAAFTSRGSAPLFDRLPLPLTVAQPVSMEEAGQNYGYILYRNRLVGPKSGTLTVTDLHDYGMVFLDGKFIGSIDRTKGENSLTLPNSASAMPVLDILVEGMGRVNFGPQLLDRKGITERVTLGGVTLMQWELFRLPMGSGWRDTLQYSGGDGSARGPALHRFTVPVDMAGDTYLDLSAWTKGVAWVNGHHLGRYWNAGPQRKLFVPGVWLRHGENDVVVFDLYQGRPVALSFESK